MKKCLQSPISHTDSFKMAENENTSSVPNLYCVEYPGNVRNADRMIETLGGLNALSNIFSDPHRKLELRFRPEDRSCKAAIGERCNSSSFVLKVIVKREKSANNGDGENVLNRISVVGKVRQKFRFKNLNDFQYLPMEKNASGQLHSICDALDPRPMVSDSWLYESSPLFLSPKIFSRSDSIQPYLSAANAAEESAEGVIGRARDRRSNYVKFVKHNLKEVPTTPNPLTLRYISLKFITDKQILRMRQLFEERPVWMKSALQCVTKYAEVQLKYLLAVSSYRFISGPFRISWIRFGYDPRKDVSARKYQTLDYRLSSYVQSVLRENHPEKYHRGRTKACKNLDGDDDHESLDQYDENNYVYKPGVVPPQKHMFYQVCDLQIPEIQEELNSYPTSIPYHSSQGWLSEEFLNFARETIDNYVLMALQSSTKENAAPKRPRQSTRESKEKNTDYSSEEMESDRDDSDTASENDDL